MSLLKYLDPNAIKDGSIEGTKIKDDSIPGSKLQNDSIPGSKLQNASIPGYKLQDNTIEVSKIISLAQSVTWSDLKDKRDAGKLIPGQQYRITDYQCTTAQENTRAVGHTFDIIVTASDVNTLNEVARAIQHEGDEYFANNDLNAWKIWYCLDNDTTRFAWADSTNGKGVIYRMIDEFNNDIPYDFKNIQFKHPNDTTTYPYYYYTFASDNVEANTDNSIRIEKNYYSNIIMEYISANDSKRKLNRIVFIGTGYYCDGNTFGPGCANNSFGAQCRKNTFGPGCSYNTFGSDCEYNSLGTSCYRNTFGNDCEFNTLGNNCDSNTLGSYCKSNTLGPNCEFNYLDYACYYTSFGNACSYNTLGNYLYNNSFGNKCSYIKFASDSSANTKYTFYQSNHFGDGCQYILFKGAETASSSAKVQNYNFAQGLKGTSSSYLIIDGKRNRAYETYISRDTDGAIKESVIADNTNNISTLTTNLSNEISARTQADTELQTQINSKQEALTLTVKDNGNIVLANIQGQSKEFMPATPSGDPMHYAYVTAGAEYNDTGADIVKTTPWADLVDDDYEGEYGKTVLHKAGCWYLNGLGDITNAEMSTIFNLYGVYNAINSIGCCSGSKVRTLFNPYNEDLLKRTLAVDSFGSFSDLLSVPYRLVLGSACSYAFTNARNLIYIYNISLISISKLLNAFNYCYNLKFIRIIGLGINVSFSYSSGLSIKSVLYMIKNEAATSQITITLHADVYNRCMANADILAALEQHTNISLASA